MPKSAALPNTAEWPRLECSFCGKDAGRVRFLAAGAYGGLLCDACCMRATLVFIKARLASVFGG